MHQSVRSVIASLADDRHMSPDVRAAEQLVHGGEIARQVNRQPDATPAARAA